MATHALTTNTEGLPVRYLGDLWGRSFILLSTMLCRDQLSHISTHYRSLCLNPTYNGYQPEYFKVNLYRHNVKLTLFMFLDGEIRVS